MRQLLFDPIGGRALPGVVIRLARCGEYGKHDVPAQEPSVICICLHFPGDNSQCPEDHGPAGWRKGATHG